MKSFFRVIGLIVLSIIGLILLIILWSRIASEIKQSTQDKVRINISYDTVGCDPEHPLHISIFNWSSKTVLYISFDIWVYQPGYSSNIISYSNNDYYVSTDKIILPNWKYDFCYIIPDLIKSDTTPNNLIYDISSKNINFQK